MEPRSCWLCSQSARSNFTIKRHYYRSKGWSNPAISRYSCMKEKNLNLGDCWGFLPFIRTISDLTSYSACLASEKIGGEYPHFVREGRKEMWPYWHRNPTCSQRSTPPTLLSKKGDLLAQEKPKRLLGPKDMLCESLGIRSHHSCIAQLHHSKTTVWREHFKFD